MAVPPAEGADVSDEFTPEEIKALRARLGLTQSQMAEKMGVHTQSYQHWEYGTRKPRGNTRKLLEMIRDEADRMEGKGKK